MKMPKLEYSEWIYGCPEIKKLKYRYQNGYWKAPCFKCENYRKISSGPTWTLYRKQQDFPVYYCADGLLCEQCLLELEQTSATYAIGEGVR